MDQNLHFDGIIQLVASDQFKTTSKAAAEKFLKHSKKIPKMFEYIQLNSEKNKKNIFQKLNSEHRMFFSFS